MKATRQAGPAPALRSAALIAAAALVSACSGGQPAPSPQAGAPEAGRPLKLAFVTNNTSEFWKIAANGVHKYEAEGKVQVDIKMPPNGKTEEQNQILENLVSQGYDAIAVSVIAPKDQVPVLNRAAEKTRLITFDSDAAGLEAPALRGHDQLRGGQDPRRADREAPARRGGRWRCSWASSPRTTRPSASRASRTRCPATASRSWSSARTRRTGPRRDPTWRTS